MPLRLFPSRNVVGRQPRHRARRRRDVLYVFLAALYLQRILGYDPFAVGLAFLPFDARHGDLCRCGYSERLIMRFGPKTTLIGGPRLDRGRPPAVRPHAGGRRTS